MRFLLRAAGSLQVVFFFLVGNGRCGGCLVARKWENGGDDLPGVLVRVWVVVGRMVVKFFRGGSCWL